ncbi:hypothetical protein B194_4340 [Serratia plymuthica A30]|nr:hypothetical protein B194_4340 [Serratia plymuthica A30]
MAFSFLCQRGRHPLLRLPTSALPVCPQVSAAYWNEHKALSI